MSNFWQTFDEAAARFAGNTAIEIQRAAGLERVTFQDLKTWSEGVATVSYTHLTLPTSDLV